MQVTVAIGTQWGDEGKGKIVDCLSKNADIVARYQGGGNAGHEVVLGEKHYVLHLIPAGVLRSGKLCLIGNGTVIDPRSLLTEMADLRHQGIRVDPRNLRISENAHVTLPYHRLLDSAHESRLGKHKIGTTGRGIGPTYVDKIARSGIRICDLLEDCTLQERLPKVLEEKNFLLTKFYGLKPLSLKAVLREYREYARILRPYVSDTSILLEQAVRRGKSILVEGAQGTFLDVDFGTYPFVTSSNPIAGGACTGLGLGPTRINGVVGVMKAYTTRVGAGPFPTEFPQEMGDAIRGRGNEYGRTTGRARRCGWLDLVLLRSAVRLNGLSSIAVAKLDILDDLSSIQICTAYRCGKETFREFPNSYKKVHQAKPVYIEMPGWKRPTVGAQSWKDLPVNARKYLDKVSGMLGVPISMVSIGPRRDQTIIMDRRFK